MKKQYVNPIATVEGFVANEFVAICAYLSCDYGAANNGGNTKDQGSDYSGYNNGAIHVGQKDVEGSRGCGCKYNQRFLTDVDLATATISDLRIREVNTPGNEDLTCTITYWNPSTKEIHWWTRYSGESTVYYHKGTIDLMSATNPNRS